MFDYASLLDANRNGVLATTDGDRVQTRVFAYLFTVQGRPYFCTGTEKPVYAQLQKNPELSFCTFTPDFDPVLCLNGRAVFVDDRALKARALEEDPGLVPIYHAPDYPGFALFYIDLREVKTYTFADDVTVYKVNEG